MSVDDLKRSPMMAHLLDALSKHEDIGHYGRLTFAMVARPFVDEDELVKLLAQDRDTDETKARALVRQVIDRGYSPPRRERILQWQKEQDFPIIPNADDPDAGNVYRELDFPDDVYDHIQEYHVEEAQAEERQSS